MIVDKFSQTQKGGDRATVIKDDYHVLAIPSSDRRRFGNAFTVGLGTTRDGGGQALDYAVRGPVAELGAQPARRERR